MSNENGNQTMQAMTAFVWGAAIGAGVALLMAPRSGVETRRQLSDAALRLRDSAKDKVDGAKHMLRDGAKDVGDAIASGRDAFAAAKDTVKDNAMSRGRA